MRFNGFVGFLVVGVAGFDVVVARDFVVIIVGAPDFDVLVVFDVFVYLLIVVVFVVGSIWGASVVTSVSIGRFRVVAV